MLEHLNKTKVTPKRVVIMGSAGFVGAAVHKELLNNKIEVLPLSRKQVDLLKPNAAHALTECLSEGDALVVISAIAPAKSYDQLIDNLHIMRNVCEAIKQCQLSQVVYISSDAVYADGLSQLNEASVVQPSSFHGMAHAARELMLKSVTSNIPLAILRPSVLYGYNDPHNSYGPNRFFRNITSAQDIKLFGHGEEKRDHVFVGDIAKIVALTLLHRSQGKLNLATGHSYSFNEVAQKIISINNSSNKIEPSVRHNPVTHVHFDTTACLQAFPDFKYTELDVGLKLMRQQS